MFLKISRLDFTKKSRRVTSLSGERILGLALSREHAPLIIKMAGIDAIIATSFARIFYRNAINVGLAAIICNTDGINERDVLEIKVDEGLLIDENKNDERSFSPLSPIMRAILNEGGLTAILHGMEDSKFERYNYASLYRR